MLSVVLLTSTLIALAGARVYDRCELARDLLRLGVSRDQVPTWVCIAFHESRFDTAAWNRYSGDHGLLQISELYWCGPGKACGVSCSSLRDTDITNDIKCALRIYKEHTRLQGDGFMAWVVYPQFCRGNRNYIKDCSRIGKNYSEKLNNIGQLQSKSDVLNFTVPQYVDTGNVNQPLPSYLAINSLIQEIDFEKFERDYYNLNKRKFDWQNYKIDNIDELKLPVAGRRGRIELAIPPTATTYTTITTERITSTLEPALRGIKPPSPRKIETDQFRRKKMKLVHEPYKTDNDTLVTTSVVLPSSLLTITNTTLSPETTLKELSSQTFTEDFLSQTTTIKSTTGTTLRTTGETNSEIPNLMRTKKPTTENPATSTALTTRNIYKPFRGATFYSSPLGSTTSPGLIQDPPEKNNSKFIEVTTQQPRYTFSNLIYNRLQNKTFQNSNDNQNISLSNTNANKTSALYLSEITSTTPSIIRNSQEIVLNKTSTSTITSPTSTEQQKFPYSQPTTQTPIFTSSSSLTAAPQTSKVDSGTSTAGTTLSIFDLYLNPTRKPTLQPFSFAPFNKNPFRVRIFSGGTTPSPGGENRG